MRRIKRRAPAKARWPFPRFYGEARPGRPVISGIVNRCDNPGAGAPSRFWTPLAQTMVSWRVFGRS
eukprot:6926922-Lingulodinium_polyedra.AAC.1